jgi:oligopeptidase B
MINQKKNSLKYSVHASILFKFLLLACISLICVFCGENVKPPIANKIKKELSTHGDTRIDYYYWLNQRNNPEVIGLLKAENEYLNARMSDTKSLQEKIYTEITKRIKKTDISVPYKYQGYYYYTRYQEKNEYPIYCRKANDLKAKEEILLDVNLMSKGHSYYHVTTPEISPDNSLIAFGVDTVSRRKYSLHFKNLSTGEILRESIPNTTGDVVWANDSRTVFYTTIDYTLRPDKLYRHIIRTDISDDKEVYHEDNPTFSLYLNKSKSKSFIFLNSWHTLSSEYRYLDADSPMGKWKIIQPREKGLEYEPEHYRDSFFIKTNYKARNFRLMRTEIGKTSKENWQEVIPYREIVLLEGFEIFKNFLVLTERIDGLAHLRVIRWDGKDDYDVQFDEPAYTVYFSKNPEFETDLLRFFYTSLKTPESEYDYNMNTRKKILLKMQEILGGYDPGNYTSERMFAVAEDKTRIPISLVYRKGLIKNGNNPLLLYGYGSYGWCTEPVFRSDRLSLLDRGFVFAIAHVRGGEEMGRQWYEGGKLLKKKNTFTDFIACTEYLIGEKYTRPQKMFAMGRSAGGLLMGALANMRPDLFKAIIAEVPWVDVVTTMLDSSIPLTTAEYDEWGDPRNKACYDYMLSYSPYDNVGPKKYPAMFVTTGFHDSQVQYFEPLKWVQKLRTMNRGSEPIFLHVNMEGGHGGISGRFRRYRETALEYAFMLDLIGIKK